MSFLFCVTQPFPSPHLSHTPPFPIRYEILRGSITSYSNIPSSLKQNRGPDLSHHLRSHARMHIASATSALSTMLLGSRVSRYTRLALSLARWNNYIFTINHEQQQHRLPPNEQVRRASMGESLRQRQLDDPKRPVLRAGRSVPVQRPVQVHALVAAGERILHRGVYDGNGGGRRLPV